MCACVCFRTFDVRYSILTDYRRLHMDTIVDWKPVVSVFRATTGCTRLCTTCVGNVYE